MKIIKQNWLHKVPHAMELNTLVVVYVQIVALGSSKHRIILQKANIVYLLFGLKFNNEVLALPVKHS